MDALIKKKNLVSSQLILSCNIVSGYSSKKAKEFPIDYIIYLICIVF